MARQQTSRHSKLLAGVLCLALPGLVRADLINTASVSYRDGAGTLLSGQSNTVTVQIVTIQVSPPSPPDVSGIDGKVFGPGQAIVLPYTGSATLFNWEFDPLDNASAATAAFASRAPAASARVSTAVPRLDLAAVSLANGGYLLRVQAVENSLSSAWVSAHITWISTLNLSAVKVYPDPFRAARGDSQVHFTQLPANSTIKLFTVSGRWIKTLHAPAGQATWDLTNDSGDPVASGIYLYLITDNGGSKIHGKVTLIR